jgi:periplasmic divalent cation tolerance protein
MQSAEQFSLALVTAPDIDVARNLSKAALEARLIACANLVPQVESHYWWDGKIESGNEILMILKAPKEELADLEAFILELHPYDTPEFLVVPLDSGSAQYLAWLADSCLIKPT